jgi:hypothetical protein
MTEETGGVDESAMAAPTTRETGSKGVIPYSKRTPASRRCRSSIRREKVDGRPLASRPLAEEELEQAPGNPRLPGANFYSLQPLVELNYVEVSKTDTWAVSEEQFEPPSLVHSGFRPVMYSKRDLPDLESS